VALSLVHRSEARTTATPTTSRDGLRALAVAWRSTQQPTVRPSARVGLPSDAPSSVTGDDEPGDWPDGPSAA